MKNLLTNWRFWAGLGTAGFCALLGALILIPLGVIDTSALPEPGWLESHVGPWAMNASRRHHAPTTLNPYKQDPEVMAVGLDHYRENCLPCHGASGISASEFAEGLHPSAPHLTIPRIQDLTDGELFWTIRNGIMMTGMPGFGGTHTDDEVWKIVAFVRHLPNLTDDEQAALRVGQAMDHHHSEDHGSSDHGQHESMSAATPTDVETHPSGGTAHSPDHSTAPSPVPHEAAPPTPTGSPDENLHATP